MRHARAAWLPSVLALSVLVLGAGLLQVGRLTAPPAVPEQSLARGTVAPRAAQPTPPERLGVWVGTPIKVEPRVFEILDTENVDLMEYRLGAEPPVWFARVAGLGNRASFHPPEVCLVGNNFTILERTPMTVFAGGQPHPVMRLVTAQGDKQFESWYWFTANRKVTPSYFQQQLWIVLGSIHHKPASGTLVRISTPMDNPATARRRLLTFLASWDGAQEAGSPHGS